MTVMDTGSVIHHPRLRSGVGVGGMAGFYDAPRKTSGDDIPRDTSSGEGKSADGSRDTSGTDGHIETETEGSYDTAPSQEPSTADLLCPLPRTQ